MSDLDIYPKTLLDLLGTPENPVTFLEFVEFWKSLSSEEKTYYQDSSKQLTREY